MNNIIYEIELLKDISKHLKKHIKEGNYDDLDIEQLEKIKVLLKDLNKVRTDMCIGGGILIPANKIKKTDEIWKYSNPKKAQNNAFKYLGSNAIIYKSPKKNKKFMISNNGKWVHFGQMGYEDYLKHKNFNRMKRYRARATNIKGDWKDNPLSANNLSINILW